MSDAQSTSVQGPAAGPAPSWAQIRSAVLARAANRCEECQVVDGAVATARDGALYRVVLQVLPWAGVDPRALCQACARKRYGRVEVTP